MQKTDEEKLKWAIEKYWREKSDIELADSLKTTIDEVQKMRETLGFKRESLKEFARRYLLQMSEKEKIEFIKSLPAEMVWKMGEGNPHSTSDLTTGGEPIRIDITNQLLKVYGNLNTLRGGATEVLTDGEGSQLPS